MKNSVIFLVIVLFFGCSEHRFNYLLNKASEPKFLKADVLTSDGILKANYLLKVADKDYQLRTGIMFEDKMDGYDGILMFCDGCRFNTIHSKNVKIPLDIVLLDEDNRISYTGNLKEESENGVYYSLKFKNNLQKVIEFEKGRASELKIGDRFIFYER